jgi:hypothetical protein
MFLVDFKRYAGGTSNIVRGARQAGDYGNSAIQPALLGWTGGKSRDTIRACRFPGMEAHAMKRVRCGVFTIVAAAFGLVDPGAPARASDPDLARAEDIRAQRC